MRTPLQKPLLIVAILLLFAAGQAQAVLHSLKHHLEQPQSAGKCVVCDLAQHAPVVENVGTPESAEPAIADTVLPSPPRPVRVCLHLCLAPRPPPASGVV